MNGSNQNVIVICCFFSLGPISGMAKCSRTWLEWIRLSRIFRAPFANLSLEIVKKMSRYYLLSGLSRIFRKPFANVYISRKVPFAQTSQIYACGPRLYKTFHGFLHDSHIYIYVYIQKKKNNNCFGGLDRVNHHVCGGQFCGRLLVVSSAFGIESVYWHLFVGSKLRIKPSW